MTDKNWLQEAVDRGEIQENPQRLWADEDQHDKQEVEQEQEAKQNNCLNDSSTTVNPHITDNREQWLDMAVDSIRDLYRLNGRSLPENVKVSIGEPKGKKAGICYSPECSEDNVNHIFINPEHCNRNSMKYLLFVLLHETAHVIAGVNAKHGKDFKAVLWDAGVAGKTLKEMQAGDNLSIAFEEILRRIGNVPQERLHLEKGEGKQSTRLLKAACPSCGYTIRVTRKWVNEAGLPTCVCLTIFELDEGGE